MIVVVGAGAAGLCAAIFAASGRHPVTLLERTRDGGRKILISGGGRCNVLPGKLEPQRFVSDSPRPLVQRLLRSWPLKAQHDFFEHAVGVPLAFEADTRKWFPASNRARDVRDGLVALAARRGVSLQFETEVRDLHPVERGWRVETTRGGMDADSVVLATGGLSVPSTGSTGTGLGLARGLEIRVHETYPALTPLVASPPRHAHLAGLSLRVRLRAAADHLEASAEGGFLFTHRGYSGPSVLDVSHVAVRTATAPAGRAMLHVRWCDWNATEWNAALMRGTGHLVNIVGRRLPQRLAEQVMAEAGIPADRRSVDLRRSERTRLVDYLVRYKLPWTVDEGYRKAEVTGGGVALDEVDPRTLESRRHKGLYLCGEMLDAFGPIGGHNFAWAWATGRLAGRGARARGNGGHAGNGDELLEPPRARSERSGVGLAGSQA